MGSEPFLRAGEQRVELFNSGLEVWLYDDAHREAIRASGAMAFAEPASAGALADVMAAGMLLGYGLMQDDGLHVGVIVGDSLSDEELAVAAWLEPQRAFLDVPSGRVAIESNDACRLFADPPGEQGATVDVPPGRYRVTLHRIDHEALERQGRSWTGPSEVIVLTPGGRDSDAATALLPWEPRRDTAWVGRHDIADGHAEALIWFGDGWDTCLINLDTPALARLGAEPGRHLRATVPAANLSLVLAVGPSWTEARRIGWPAGPRPGEYGYGAVQPMADWNGAEALFCRRSHTTLRVEDAHQTTWLPASIDLLPPSPTDAAWSADAPGSGPRRAGALIDRPYFEPGFLSVVLSDVLPGADDDPDLPIERAVDRLDARMTALGLVPAGDMTFATTFRGVALESTCRFYLGDPACYGVVRGADASIDVLFVSRSGSGWIVTGLADSFDTAIASGAGTGAVRLTNLDDEVGSLLDAHREAIADEATAPPPDSLDAAAADFDDLLRSVFC